MLKKLALRLLSNAGYEVFNKRMYHARDELYTRNQPTFLNNAAFMNAYQRGIDASHGVDPGFHWRVHIALWAADLARRVEGDFVECGVNAGFVSSSIMRHLNWDRLGRTYYLIDTFSGPPMDQFSDVEVSNGRAGLARDAIERGAYVTDLDRIRGNFAEWKNVRIVQGSIPDVLAGVQPTVAFLHIDLNCAMPERAALLHFWPLLSEGGVILLDDYCYQGHEAQAEALDLTAHELGADILALPTGQGLIIR